MTENPELDRAMRNASLEQIGWYLVKHHGAESHTFPKCVRVSVKIPRNTEASEKPVKTRRRRRRKQLPDRVTL